MRPTEAQETNRSKPKGLYQTENILHRKCKERNIQQIGKEKKKKHLQATCQTKNLQNISATQKGNRNDKTTEKKKSNCEMDKGSQ